MGAGTYCFDVEAFAHEDFNVAGFLEDCRTRSPMETIHQDLRAFQTTLENQLVAIINEDYTEFLQLSSKLKGVDEAVSSVRAPLQAILKRVDQVQKMLLALQTKIHSQLQLERDLQQSEQDLELSISVAEKITLLEELLEIPSFEDEDGDEPQPQSSEACDSDDDDGFDNFDAVKRANREGNTTESCAMLERATHLLLRLDLEFLEGVDIPTVQREEKRLAVIEETLLRRLETEFATEIFPDTFYNRDHLISASTLSYLLRSYVLLHKAHVPEEMIARLLVQPFAEENITRGKLDGRARGSCEGLQFVFDEILEFISQKFKDILQLPVCSGDSKCSVDILGNAIWKPLCEVLSAKHSVIFKTADPDRFHHNYTISMRFLEQIEDFCVTDVMKTRFKTHESVVEFKEKWNMEVYFQLRYNNFAVSVNKSFGVPRSHQSTKVETTELFHFPSTRSTWSAVTACFDDSVFLVPLVSDFTRFCLQLLLHFVAVWTDPVNQAVAQVTSSSKPNFSDIHFVGISNEEDLMYAAADFHTLSEKIMNELVPKIETKTSLFVDSSSSFAEECFEEVVESLRNLENQSWTAVAALVAEECKKVLPALRTIKGQYQMTNKPPPTVPSTYVSNIIRPLEDFLNRWGSYFSVEQKESVIHSIVDPICELYHSLSSEILKSAQELEESLKSRKIQRSAATGAGISDTEKMRLQFRLDLDELHRLVQELGVCLDSNEVFELARTSLNNDS